MSPKAVRELPDYIWDLGLWALALLIAGNLYFIRDLVDGIKSTQVEVATIKSDIAVIQTDIKWIKETQARSKLPEVKSAAFQCCGEGSTDC